MKIRCVTQFIPLSWPFDEGYISSAARLLADARHRFTDAGFEVQSIGVATPPFIDVLGYPETALVLDFALRLDDLARKHHLDFVSIGPVIATTPRALLMPIHALPQAIAQTERVTAGVLFADSYSGVNLAAARALAQTVLKVANTTALGAGNLRLGALANVPAHTPHSPAAYQQGSNASFAIATEAADLAVAAVNSARTLNGVQTQLTAAIEAHTGQLLKIADALVDDHQVQFMGIDFSLAPFPQQGRSLGAAIERLGVQSFGGGGTLFGLSVLARALQAVNMPRVGFSGVMLSVLADKVIAHQPPAISDLLLYAAIGGAGLDLLPIPGETSADEIAAIYLDLAALSLATGRPLSARLLPIPGATAGDRVDLAQPGLTGSTVIEVKKSNPALLLEQNSFFAVAPRKKTKLSPKTR